jgi:pimeloyl-ACP methyl ester carboxylesterase
MKRIVILVLTFTSYLVQGQQIFKTFSSFDKTTIAFSDEGKGSPIILLHGFISSGNSWQQTALKKDLLLNGYRVIIPDLRGNGNSDRPHNSAAYANDAEVKDIVALADHLQLPSYSAVGYSRGAIVLAKLLVNEERIDLAVLGGMGLDFTNREWDRRIMFQEAFSGSVPLNEMTSGAVNYAKSIGADLKILGLLQEFQPVTTIDELKKIKAKVLVIAGDKDTDNGNPEELQQKIKGADLIIVAGDHNNTYKSKVFSTEILSFLKK